MPGDANFLYHVMELLEPIGDIASRAMFGGYGIFHRGDMFALISGSTLYFKVDKTNLSRYEEACMSQFKPMPYYEVPTEVIEDSDLIWEWADISIAIGHATAKKKKG